MNQKENESRECEAHNSSKPRTTLFLQIMGCATCVCVCVGCGGGGGGGLYQLKYHGRLEGWAQSVINNTIQGKWKLRVTPVWKIASHMGQKTMHV